jgi:transketolase
MTCRAIPNLLVLRPSDANEALVASRIAFEQTSRPALVLLTRQGLPVFDRNTYPPAEEIRKGGYVMQDCDGEADVVIMSTGSEVWVALEVADLLVNCKVRVVNIGSWELFDEQSEEYRQAVLGDDSTLRVSIEAGVTLGWEHYTGINGLNIGIDSFGESAPGGEVANHFGITPEKVVEKIQKRLN